MKITIIVINIIYVHTERKREGRREREKDLTRRRVVIKKMYEHVHIELIYSRNVLRTAY